MPGIKPEDCRPGDIVLFYGFNLVSASLMAATALKTVTVLPAVVSAAQGGSTAFSGNLLANHAGIVCDGPEGLGCDLAHATNESGIHRKNLKFLCTGASGTLQVFRSMIGTIAKEAADVARTWASRHEGTMKFASDKATSSAFQSSAYGPAAKQRAQFYRSARTHEGGPSDWKDFVEQKRKSMFCSMFVIACYQAVMPDDLIELVLSLDAKHTSPTYLDGYLRNSKCWRTVGAIAHD